MSFYVARYHQGFKELLTVRLGPAVLALWVLLFLERRYSGAEEAAGCITGMDTCGGANGGSAKREAPACYAGTAGLDAKNEISERATVGD